MKATRIIFEPVIKNGKPFTDHVVTGEYFLENGKIFKWGLEERSFTKVPIYTRKEEEFIIPKWKPNHLRTYYIPDFSAVDNFSSCTWTGDFGDERHYSDGLVCQTPDEAIEKAKKMLEAIKEES